MSNTYGASMSTAAPLGGSITDLVNTQKGGVQNLGAVAQALTNVFPPATASTSPVFLAVNNLGTVGTTVMGSTAGLTGLIVHNPATSAINAYIYSLSIATTPTLSAPGGALLIFPGETVAFPSIFFANINVGFGGFVSTGTAGALTILQFF